MTNFNIQKAKGMFLQRHKGLGAINRPPGIFLSACTRLRKPLGWPVIAGVIKLKANTRLGWVLISIFLVLLGLILFAYKADSGIDHMESGNAVGDAATIATPSAALVSTPLHKIEPAIFWLIPPPAGVTNNPRKPAANISVQVKTKRTLIPKPKQKPVAITVNIKHKPPHAFAKQRKPISVVAKNKHNPSSDSANQWSIKKHDQL
jgi:hypothetical protein